MPNLRVLAFFAVCLALLVAPLRAQDRTLPYWATLRFEKVNMRVGPSNEYPITWVYVRKGLPVKVVRIREGWRLVEDHQGEQGWIAASQLDPARGAMVVGEGVVDLRAQPNPSSALRWRAEPGVVGRLGTCREGWCEVDVAGRKGWISAARLWGAESLPGDE
jgi:SH3-like domain-containing protein